MLSWWRHNLSFSCVLLLGMMAGYAILAATPMLLKKPTLLLGMGGVLVYALIMVISPEKALAILLLFRALMDRVLESTRIELGGQYIGLGAGINLAVIALTVVFAVRAMKRNIPSQHVLAWISFLAIMLFAVLYSPDSGRAARLWFNFVSYFCMFALPFLLVDTLEKKRFWWKILLGSLILSVFFADIDWLRGGQYSAYAGARVLGTFTHPNILAFYLVWGIVIVLYALLREDWKWTTGTKIFFQFLIANMVFLLLMTKTRNAWIAAWITFFLYGFRHDKRLAIALLVLPPLALLVPSLSERIMDVFQPDHLRSFQQENSWSWRLKLWERSVPWIMKSPFIGHGLCSFVPLSVNFFKSDSGGVGAHNVFVELLFETGLIGLTAYWGIFLMILRDLGRKVVAVSGKARAETLALVYVISYLVINIADNLLYYLVFNWYFWFFVGIVLVDRFRFSTVPQEVAV